MESVKEQLLERLDIGRKRYGHGVIVDSDTRKWGTPKNSWIDMAIEEFLDGIIYVVADYIRAGRQSHKMLSELELDYKVNDKFAECEDPVKYLLEMQEPDDNKLIMYIVKNHDRIESPKHRMMVWNLLNILFVSSHF